jgi:hypothetical protein
MLFGRRRIEKVVSGDIVPDKKSVHAGNVAADQSIAFAASEPDERFEAGAEIRR